LGWLMERYRWAVPARLFFVAAVMASGVAVLAFPFGIPADLGAKIRLFLRLLSNSLVHSIEFT
jgi:hypothetical protein